LLQPRAGSQLSSFYSTIRALSKIDFESKAA
jgi:hypothetical protein